jgi:hypothetical protein
MMALMHLSRGRRIAIWSLLIAGGITAVLTIFAVWAARQLLDEDRWNDTTTALVADPAVQSALATFLVDQLYENVDLSGELQAVLPPRLDVLAKPAVGALREPLTESVQRLLASAPVQEAWNRAASLTHQQFINLVEERGTALRTPGGGGVVLDLKVLLVEIGQKLGLPVTGERLPADAAVIKILSPDQLDAMQKIVNLLRTLAWVLLAVTVVLLAAAVWLARGRRRETLVNATLTVIIAAILVLLLRRIVGNQIIGDLGQTATGQEAATEVWRIGTSVLAQVARTLLLLAVVLLVAGVLAGPATWAQRFRDWARPALIHSPGMVHGVVLVVLLGILALGIIPSVRTLAAAVLLIIVTVGGVELVRRSALADEQQAAPRPPAPA